jgi:hypothetical protein
MKLVWWHTSTQEIEAGGLQVQGQSGLLSKTLPQKKQYNPCMAYNIQTIFKMLYKYFQHQPAS